ncbi:hypothetical protein F4810DRAFT_393985 [Camillea tinctor]|nr:hypothetical protein F4810DRAFT_393985 [Camillea tinctor]
MSQSGELMFLFAHLVTLQNLTGSITFSIYRKSKCCNSQQPPPPLPLPRGRSSAISYRRRGYGEENNEAHDIDDHHSRVAYLRLALSGFLTLQKRLQMGVANDEVACMHDRRGFPYLPSGLSKMPSISLVGHRRGAVQYVLCTLGMNVPPTCGPGPPYLAILF